MLHAPFDGLVDTEAGSAFVRVRGSGPRLLAFHGGPGFDHEPMIEGLQALLPHRTVVFFDQLGCGRTPAKSQPVTAEATFAHAAAVLDLVAGGPIGLVAHSWGMVVAAAALMRRPAFRFAETLLINPVPLDSDGYAAARATTAARIPPAVMQQLWRMVGDGADGAEAFALLLPYYVANKAARLPRISLSAPVYVSVDATLGAFDYMSAADRFGPISIIRGEEDFVDEATLAPLLDRAVLDAVVKGTGHYPLFEDPDAFADAVQRFLARPGG